MLSTVALFGAGSSAAYNVEHTFFGKIAEAHVVKDVQDDYYVIELSILTTGLVASLSDNLEKRFISQGSIVNGLYVPDVLTVLKRKDDEERFVTYRFDHQKKVLSIDMSEKSLITDNTFDPVSFSFHETKRLEYSHESHLCKSYVQNDVISLFFNAKNYVKDQKSMEQATFMAAGIDDDEEDEVDGILEFGISQEDIRDIISTSLQNSMISVNLSNFKETDRHLVIDINPDSLPQSVTLDDVAFGDVVIERVYENVAVKK
jgi:hypothetical protein